jgi:formylglycine-generating enzyme required for sulfatase activity
MMFCEKLTVQEKAAGRLPKGWVTKTGKRMGGKAYSLPTEAQKAPAKELVKAPPFPVLTAAPVEGESFSIPDINLDMLWCKPGTFMMGSPAEEKNRLDRETRHEVALTKGFYLGKYEVTQEQWEKVMGSKPSQFNGATRPVEQVSWDDAIKFCEKLTQMEKTAGRLPEGWVYTLPTEAQWEYACRAGPTTATAFGDSLSSKQANFNGDYPYGGASKGPYLRRTTNVGSYPANAWGFHDMHGNVYEWCSDWYGDYPDGSASDPVGPSAGSFRVIRGGCWNFNGQLCRSADRNRRWPDHRDYSFLGFRVGFSSIPEKK